MYIPSLQHQQKPFVYKLIRKRKSWYPTTDGASLDHRMQERLQKIGRGNSSILQLRVQFLVVLVPYMTVWKVYPVVVKNKTTSFKEVEHFVISMVNVWYVCCCKELNMKINVTSYMWWLFCHVKYTNTVSRVSINIKYAFRCLPSRSKVAHHDSRCGIRKYCFSCC